MKKTIYLFAIVFILICSTSCATMFADDSDEITVFSDPVGATVKIDGFVVGVTPFRTILDRDSRHFVEVSKDGYEPAGMTISRKVGVGWIIWDVIGWGIIGVGVDGLTGNWFKLSPTELRFNLIEQPDKSK